MPTDLEKPEPFFFAFSHQGESFAIRVDAASYGAAKHLFSVMSPAEKRARVVGRLRRRERDHVAEFGHWLSGFLQRRRAA